MKDRSDDPSHHEGTLLQWSYILFPNQKEQPVRWQPGVSYLIISVVSNHMLNMLERNNNNNNNNNNKYKNK